MSQFLENYTIEKESKSRQNDDDKYLPYCSALDLDSSWYKIYTSFYKDHYTNNQPPGHIGTLWNHSTTADIGNNFLD